MTDDQPSKLEGFLLREIDSGMKTLEEYFLALKAARRKTGSSSPPWTSRFTNMPTINAVRQYLIDERKGQGATAAEIYEALTMGGAAYNQPHFERDLKNSLGRASKSGRSLIKKGDKYYPGPEDPANKKNRHGKRPLK